MTSDLAIQVTEIARQARRAALALATLPTDRKNKALLHLAERLPAAREALMAANRKDLEQAPGYGLTDAQIDRLRLTDDRIRQMADGCRQVAALPDPVGEEIERHIRPDGLDIRRIRVPLGVIGIIYEARPNVTVDCAILCLKSGNAAILRGGKEIFHTNQALAALIAEALAAAELPPAAVQLIPTTDRAALNTLLKLDGMVNCVIPRGGEGLIRFVAENSTVPVIKHYAGVCNLYIDRDADPDLAEAITVNAKTQRPGVCNAIENLVIHADVAPNLLPRIARALVERNVELRADSEGARILKDAGIAAVPAEETDWREEYLDLILAIRVVESADEAIDFINTYGSAHSDAIVTRDEPTARRFLGGVDSATVYWNASTRFTDGFEFGMGAEIGISTDKLHARGPMGLRELCSYKFVIFGSGQIRAG